MTTSPRFEVRKTDSFKCYHPKGYTLTRGFGVYDTFAGAFVADDAENTPVWSFKTKGVALDIVQQFNTIGPSAKLFYAVPLQ